MSKFIEKRLASKGPKRILALDGGGIRGAVTVGFLKKIETLLRERHNNPELLLCDYFDLIGGTSTGSIIATLLALGKSADEIERLYNALGEKIFGHQMSLWNPMEWSEWMSADFDAAPLEHELKNLLGDLTLGSEAVLTGLCIVAKRADTFSTWPISNNPRAPYFGPPYLNGDYKLRDVIRASTAAPTYFRPQSIHIGENQQGVFVDGGISMANNPAWQFFLMATLKGYRFDWKTGDRNLMVVSIGTGTHTKLRNPALAENFNKLEWAKEIPDLFMEDASWQNQTMLQYLSNSPTRFVIDREIGNMEGEVLGGKPQLFYLRYNAWLEKPSEKELLTNAKPDLTRHFSEADLVDMREMSNAKRVNDLTKVGHVSAEFFVKETHFPEWFDLKKA